MDSVNMALEGIDKKRQRRKYTKQYQRYLEERFEPQLRKLTRSEGQILSKLIYRETGQPVYDIIKTYRNGQVRFGRWPPGGMILIWSARMILWMILKISSLKTS